MRCGRWLGIAILLLVGASLFLWQASKAPCWQLVGKVTCRVETTQSLVALSFDDGPTAEGVDALLPELEKRGIKATFFLIGDQIEKSPAQAVRLAKAGMELANHSYSHQRMVGSSEAHYTEEIARTDLLLQKATGVKPTLFRPPFGKRLIGLPRAVDRAGYRMVTWDVADDISGHRSSDAYAKDIVDRARAGSIILIHPMYRGNAVERAAIPAILDGLAAKGLKVVTVSALLEQEGK